VSAVGMTTMGRVPLSTYTSSPTPKVGTAEGRGAPPADTPGPGTYTTEVTIGRYDGGAGRLSDGGAALRPCLCGVVCACVCGDDGSSAALVLLTAPLHPCSEQCVRLCVRDMCAATLWRDLWVCLPL
jgi:hypothetical protein